MADTLQLYNNSAGGSYHGLSATIWYGEYFTPTATFKLSLLKWKAMRHGTSYSGYVTLKVYRANASNQPAGPLLASINVNVSSFVAYPSSSWYSVDLSSFNVIMSQGIKYCWFMDSTYGTGAFIYDGGDDLDGAGMKTANGGTSWSGNADLKYEIWGQTVTSVVAGAVTPGDNSALCEATIDGGDTISQYGYEWVADTTGLEPFVYDHEALESGSPGASYSTVLPGLLPGHAYWCRPKVYLTSYGWVYGAAALFVTTLDDAWTDYASYTGSGGQQYFSTQYRAYNLFTGITHLCMGLKLNIYRDATLTGGLIYAAIYETAAGKPTGSALITAQLPEALIGTSAAWYGFGFEGGVPLQDGVVYAVVVWASNGAYASPMGHWVYGTPGGGNKGRSQDYGVTWIGPESGFHAYYDYGVEGLDIETNPATDIKHNRVTLWGNILMIGPATEYGFDYSLGTGDFEEEILGTDPIIEGLFCILLTGLTYNTSYKFRAKMRATGGAWTYGVTEYFTTSFPVPQCATEPPDGADSHTIDAVGCLESDSENAVDSYGFVYGCTTVEDMLGRFDADIIDHNYSPADAIADGYDSNEQVEGQLTAPLLASNAASGQADVVVVSATGLVDGQTVKLVDTDNEEELVIDHIAGTTITMTTNLVNSYTTAKSAQLQGMVTIQLRNLEYGKRYYFRFWAHNQYGYGWGSELAALTSDTVNLIIPTSTASKGIRFCVPGKVNFPPTGMYYDGRHHLLVRAPDSYFDPDVGAFGWVYGKYVCERQYWWEATNVDLYDMSNPSKRDGTVIKVKYKARIGNNSYGLGAYHKRVINNGASSLTSAYIGSGMGNPGWYCEIWYNNPWTSNPWTVEEIDDLQMGISIRSGTGFEIPMCDCIEGRVLWANAAVTTKAPLHCTPTSVQFRGLVTEDECEECEVYFEYGPTTAYGSSTTPQAAVKGQLITDTIAYTPPAPGTYYHYRAVITTLCGETFYGADMLYPNGLILELAFEQSILTVAPVWTDVTTYCMKLHTKRGRMHQLDKCEAGVGTFILNNATGDWYRYNTAGAFYGAAGGVKPLTLVRLRYSYNGINHLYYGVAESFKPKWLQAAGGFSPVMELNCVDVFKSFTRYKIVDANPALIEDAASGHDYVYVDSTNGLVEGQSIRIYEGDTTETTTINQIVPSLNLVIFNDVLANDYSTSAKLKKFPSVLTGQRIRDILLEVRWPLALTSIDDGQVMVVELTPSTGGDNAMDALFKTTEAEAGNLFVAANGWVVFQDAVARTKAVSTDLYPSTDALTASQATFSDDGVSSKYYLPELSDDDDFIYNECSISGDEIGEQVMLDADLQLEQGPRVASKTDSPLADEADAFDQATITVEKYKVSKPRCASLAIRPDADAEDLWPKVLGYDLGVKVTLQLNSTMNPAAMDVPYHIEGVTHDWEASTGLWETKWQLWDVNKYYMFRSINDGWLKNVWPEPYTYADIHDDPTAAYLYQDEEAPLQLGQVPYIAFSFNEEIRRGLLKFDTGALADLGNIVSARIILMLKPQLSIYTRAAFDLCIVGDGGAVFNLVPGDYGKLLTETEIYGSVTVPEAFREPDPLHPVGVYMLAVMELTAAGIAHINKYGTSFFGLRSKQDIDAVEPDGGVAEFVYVEGHLGEFAPRLMVQIE